MALRRLLPFATAAGVAAALATAVPAVPALAASAPLQLTLPAPTGRDQVGTVSLHLVQNGRQDPWAPGRARELMVNLTYPARHADRYPTAPYMTPGAWASFEHNQGIPAGSVIVPQTAAHEGAAVDRRHGGLPVILFSPGFQGDRTQDTALVQDLASRGYLVATIDHTYIDDEVEFPDGRVAQPAPRQISIELAERVKDVEFVLDELTAIDHRQNPDADHHPLPHGLRGALDLNRVAMFGHSGGGTTTYVTMLDDPRIKAGIDMDGKVIPQSVLGSTLNRPFLLLGREDHTRDSDPSWAQFWNDSTGWKRDFRLQGSQHLSYSDAEFLLPQAASVIGLTPDDLKALIGTIDPARAFTVESTYVDAFFDRHLRHHDEPVLDGPSSQFPEMVFEP